eukprot:6076323-Pyramimonas_sp.AAC.1
MLSERGLRRASCRLVCYHHCPIYPHIGFLVTALPRSGDITGASIGVWISSLNHLPFHNILGVFFSHQVCTNPKLEFALMNDQLEVLGLTEARQHAKQLDASIGQTKWAELAEALISGSSIKSELFVPGHAYG